MDTIDGDHDGQTPLTIEDTLHIDFIPLSRAAMVEVGPAAQTLGAIYLMANESRGFQTFAPIADFERLAGVRGARFRFTSRPSLNSAGLNRRGASF